VAPELVVPARKGGLRTIESTAGGGGVIGRKLRAARFVVPDSLLTAGRSCSIREFMTMWWLAYTSRQIER